MQTPDFRSQTFEQGCLTDREVIIALAELVMEWKVVEDLVSDDIYSEDKDYDQLVIESDGVRNSLHSGRDEEPSMRDWNPLKNLAHAWMLVERLQDRLECSFAIWDVAPMSHAPGPIAAFALTPHRPPEIRDGVHEPTVPRAISMAALQVMLGHQRRLGSGSG